MIDHVNFTSTAPEEEMFEAKLSLEYTEARCPGYDTGVITLLNYVLAEGLDTQKYLDEVLTEATTSLAQTLNKVNFAEFEKPPILPAAKESGIIQVVGGFKGFWFRKTTESRLFYGDQGEGYLTTYEVFARTSPRIVVK